MLTGIRLPDAVMGETGPGWEAWEQIGDDGYKEVSAPLGAYMKVRNRKDGELGDWCWYVRDPLGEVCTIRDNHQVTELPDRTITITPSIVNPNGSYHGFLQAGVWT